MANFSTEAKTPSGLLGPESRYVYYIIAPITGSGIAFLGDGGKIVSTGKKRIANLISAAKKLQVKVVFAKDESTITLRGYGTHEVVSDKGKISWDSKTHLFTLTLHSQPGENSVIVNFREK